MLPRTVSPLAPALSPRRGERETATSSFASVVTGSDGDEAPSENVV